jgi:hypothetical protein
MIRSYCSFISIYFSTFGLSLDDFTTNTFQSGILLVCMHLLFISSLTGTMLVVLPVFEGFVIGCTACTHGFHGCPKIQSTSPQLVSGCGRYSSHSHVSYTLLILLIITRHQDADYHPNISDHNPNPRQTPSRVGMCSASSSSRSGSTTATSGC